MNRREANAALLSGLVLTAMPFAAATAQEPKSLPPPDKAGGMPLMQALELRRSSREFSPRKIPDQVLSNLLWAAYGINRPAGDRTAPSWRHFIVTEIYAVMEGGAWHYDPARHTLVPHLATDIRAHTGRQDFVAVAPLNLVYAAQGERMKDVSDADRRLYSSVNAAFSGQNVYLYCASAGLATVFRGAVDYPRLEKAMRLPQGQFVTFAQTVGYPKGT